MVALMGIVYALLAAIGLATQAIFIRMGTQDGRPEDALIIVLLVDLAIFVPYAGVAHFPDYRLTPTAIGAFVLAGVLAMMLGRAFLYGGIERVGASRAEPLKATQAIPAALGGIFLLGETATPIHLVGIVVIIAGVAAISSERAPEGSTGSAESTRLGLLLVLASALCFGFDGVIAKVGFAEGTPVFVAVALKLIAGATGFSLYLLWRDEFPPVSDLFTREAVWFGAAGLSSALFLFAFYAGIEVAPVVVVVPVMQTSPLLVALISYLFLQRLERVTPRLVAGACMVVAGTVAVTVAG